MSSNLLGRGWPPEHPRAVRAEGRHIWTADGERLLDASSSGLAGTLGYGATDIVRAISEQATRLPFADSLSFTTEVAEELASEVAKEFPGDLDRTMFVTGGTEAIELAMLMAHRIQAARGEPQKELFLARHLSYHGSSQTALGLGSRAALREPVSELLPAFAHVPPPYPYRPAWRERFPEAVASVPGVADFLDAPLSHEQIQRAHIDAAAAVEVAIEALGPERVCAFVAEPIIGASAGGVVPDDEYWPRVREICDRHGVLWIADEVMTGMGRTGRWLACEHWGVIPDLVALGKGISAAYQPLGAVVVRQPHWEQLSTEAPGFPYGFTFAQHPVAIAAGRAVIDVLRENDLLQLSSEAGERIRKSLRESLAEHPHVGEVRGAGLLIGIELVTDREKRTPFAREQDMTGKALAAARQAGVLLYPARGCADGIAGDAFLVAPALTITDAECNELVASVVEALGSLTA